MKLGKLVLLVGLAGLCLAVSLALCQEESAESKAVDSRSKLALPKIFDFERFKSMFNRKYSSVLEELARKRIFLARAFQAFLSFVGFKHYKSDYYLKITPMSDWTVPEFEATLNKKFSAKPSIPIVEDPDELLLETPVASEDDIRAELAKIKADPKMAQLAKELDRATEARARRRRREVTSGRENLSVDDLMSAPTSADDDLELIPSNNPDYEAPELTSFGDDDDDKPELTMDLGALDLLKSLPGAGIVGSIFNYWYYGEEDSSAKATGLEKLPDEVLVDHRRSGCLGVAKNQKNCGSCYIFSTVALYEWQFCKEHGKRISISEQYPLDCGERVNMGGCGGGLEFQVATFFGQFGIELSKNYPYRYRSDVCPYNPFVSSKKMGYVKLNVEDGGMIGIKFPYLEKYIAYTPILMGVGVTSDFSHYGHGVDSGRTCQESRGHSMLLVGHGRQDGQEYWLFRNSYSDAWGEEGYYKLNKKASKKCFLDDGVGYLLRPKSGSTIFDLKTNADYSSLYVKKRHDDVVNHKYIPRNPINYVHDEQVSFDPNMVTPPPSHG